MKKVLVFIVLVSLIVSGCQSADKVMDLPDIQDRGYVIVGLDDTFAPMGFRLEDESLSGFDVELAREVFKRMDLEVRFQAIDWSMKEAELNNKNIDMIWNGYTITDERAKKVSFSKPYLNNRQIIVSLASSDVLTYDDLDGKVIACQSESSSEAAILKDAALVAMIKNNEAVAFSTNQEAFLDLEAGRVDAVVADEVLAMYYMSKKNIDDYRVLEQDLGKEEYGIGFRKSSSELATTVDSVLDAMRSDGFVSETSMKWFGRDIVGEE